MKHFLDTASTPYNEEQLEGHYQDLSAATRDELIAISRKGHEAVFKLLWIAIEYQNRAHIIEYHDREGLPPGDENISAEQYLQLSQETWTEAMNLYVNRNMPRASTKTISTSGNSGFIKRIKRFLRP